MSNVHVAVRVRPFSRREIHQHALDERPGILRPVLKVRNNQITTDGNAHKDGEEKVFTFDDAFSSDRLSAAQERRRMTTNKAEQAKEYASQEDIFNSIGIPFLNNAFDGYNSCIFTYGQTGSGKTYTMMGERKDDGLMPRVCKGLFQRIKNLRSATRTFRVEVTYFEIYMEKIKDLFSKKNVGHNLKVRNDTDRGPYVQGIRVMGVKSYGQIKKLLDSGNKRRTTGHTDMNDASSRSHAVFTITMTERWYDASEETTGEKSSRMSLIDLAGSERQPRGTHSHIEGESAKQSARAHVKESAKINRSLSTLGLVIKSLSEEGDALAEAAEAAARALKPGAQKAVIKKERVTAGSPSRPTKKSYSVTFGVPTQDTSKAMRTPSRPKSTPAVVVAQNTKHKKRVGLQQLKQALFGTPKSKSKRKHKSAGDVEPLLDETPDVNTDLSTTRILEMTPERGLDASKRAKFVPYRDSVLTWLLKDSLGGNSKTFMLATLSPCIDNFEETMSTLRYANSCKQIVNQAVINEDEGSVRLRRARSLAVEIACVERKEEMDESVERGDGIMNPVTYLFEWIFGGFRDPIVKQKEDAVAKSIMRFAKAQAEYAMPDTPKYRKPRSRSLYSRLSYRTKDCSQDYAIVVKSRPRSNTMFSRSAASSSPFKASPRRPKQHPSLVLEDKPRTSRRENLNVSYCSVDSDDSDDYIIPPSLDDEEQAEESERSTPARVCFSHDSTCSNCKSPVAAMVIPFRTSSAHYFPKRQSATDADQTDPLSVSLSASLSEVPASPTRLSLASTHTPTPSFESARRELSIRNSSKAPEYHIFHEGEGNPIPITPPSRSWATSPASSIDSTRSARSGVSFGAAHFDSSFLSDTSARSNVSFDSPIRPVVLRPGGLRSPVRTTRNGLSFVVESSPLRSPGRGMRGEMGKRAQSPGQSQRLQQQSALMSKLSRPKHISSKRKECEMKEVKKAAQKADPSKKQAFKLY